MSHNPHTQQQSFVDELVDRTDHVSGLRLTINKYLILFLKCLYIRKRKKIISLIELLIPLLVFYYSVFIMDSTVRLSKWEPKPSEQSRAFRSGQEKGYLFGNPLDYTSNRVIYYDFNSTNVVGADLEAFLTDALRDPFEQKR